MPACCSAPGCKSRGYNDNLTYHRFPKNPQLRQKWTEATGRSDWEPKANTVLCSKHFREEDLDRTSLSCVRVRENVIPSLFPDGTPPKHEKGKPPKRRNCKLPLPSSEALVRKEIEQQELNQVKIIVLFKNAHEH
ncbi:THAP domain-containing protein 6-like [Homalodisca vitripennis]|uniref:THAP domain-containing protein 6-like n=1 Tax=Homalodisca vitripennis TaxID=197043 RepID=UPI001EECA60F|nr:THAP domain-containing protein 6-like [Homalodisca vitripennis]